MVLDTIPSPASDSPLLIFTIIWFLSFIHSPIQHIYIEYPLFWEYSSDQNSQKTLPFPVEL